MIFTLPYHITNNGDGSASVKFHATRAEAEAADAAMDEGWGESCDGEVRLRVEDSKLFFSEYTTGGYIWVEVTQS